MQPRPRPRAPGRQVPWEALDARGVTALGVALVIAATAIGAGLGLSARRGGGAVAPAALSPAPAGIGLLPVDRRAPAPADVADVDPAIRAGSVRHAGGATVLTGVSALGGAVRAARIELPDHGLAGARVVGLRVEGVPRPSGVNAVSALGARGYVVALQEAVADGRPTIVGLRIHLYGLRPEETGRDLLVGGPPRAASGVTRRALSLEIAPVAATGGGPGDGYPLALRGAIVGCPFIPGSRHSPLAPPDNLASDNAVDIAVPVGTPVLAVADGVIGSLIGPLDSTEPHLAGLRVHLDTPTRHYYYAHLSRIDVRPGEQVVRGQQIGLSGSAAGAPHLHFAQDSGDPAVTVGQAGACPPYRFTPEAWN
jgi:Peptidase family M23